MSAEVLTHEGEEGPEALQQVADRLLEVLNLTHAELAVTLCDDAAIAELNGQWRNKPVPTDVLSFPQGDPLPGGPVLLGDVVISVDTAARQAEERGHELHDELVVLLVHGLLHLLGHDHDDDDERATMRDEEVRLLAALGLDAASLVARAG
jgi:probable rRNA maturation factor